MASAATAKAKWTVMVYMAAGDGADLDANAVSDLQEMERANVGPDINVVVQINRFWPTKPQRYRIGGGQTTLVRADIMEGEPIADGASRKRTRSQKDGANMGDMETLANFLQWSRHHYPADRYFLVLWGHAYGLGYGRDHGDPMTLPEIRDAIHTFRQPSEATAQGAVKEWPKLDLLGANACAMSYAEAACELGPEVEYLVASEIAVPLVGWPYEAILGCMSKRADADPKWDMTAEAVGQLVADRYVAQFDGSASGERVAMSVLNLSVAPALAGHVADLGQAIVNVVDGTDKGAGERLAQIRAAFLATAAGDVRPLVDLVDLSEGLDDVCVDLRELAPHPSLDGLSAAARRLAAFLVPGKEVTHDAAQAQGLEAPKLVTFVAQHKDLDGLHGIGIFAPFVTDDRDLKRLGMDPAAPDTGRPAYDQLTLATTAKTWAPLVFDRLRAGLPEPVLAGVESSGASNRADRSAVTQMLASLDSTLDTLDRRIAATRSKALANMPAVATAVPAVLGQPALNMLGMMQLLRHEDVDKMLVASTAAATLTRGVGGSAAASSTPAWSGATVGTGDQVDQTAQAFFGLERMIGQTERTIRRTLTNGSFGLGPGLGAPRDKEGLLGAPRDKEGLLGAPRDKEGLLGAGRDKEGLLGRDKEGLLGRDKEGLLGVGSPASTAAATPGAIIAELFRQVGVAMQSLETAAGDVETIAAKALLAPGGTPAFELLSHVTLAKSRLERAFRALSEASTDLRRTVHRVASHPTYGVGPGSQGMTIDDRRELASASGLNSTALTLL